MFLAGIEGVPFKLNERYAAKASNASTDVSCLRMAFDLQKHFDITKDLCSPLLATPNF